jgi:hypothetical protein
MTPVAPGLRPLLFLVQRTLRRDALTAACLLALAVVPGALLVTWFAGLVRPWSRPGAGPLLLDLLVISTAAAVFVHGLRRWVRVLDERVVAADAEARVGMADGAILGVLELSRDVPAGSSPALARHAESELAMRLAGLGPAELSGELGARVRRRRRAAVATLAGLTMLTVLLGFAAPEHSRAAWTPLAQPVGSLSQPLLPALSVLPGNVEVPRGEELRVRIDAPGRAIVTLHWRAAGDVARQEITTVGRDSTVARVPRVDAVTEYWVTAPDGAVTTRYRATPVDPLLVSQLTVDVV